MMGERGRPPVTRCTQLTTLRTISRSHPAHAGLTNPWWPRRTRRACGTPRRAPSPWCVDSPFRVCQRQRVLTSLPRTADAVVIGGGTVGAWAAWFLKQAGLDKVVLVEAATLGKGASSRAAGMV